MIVSFKQEHFKLIENYHTHDTRQRRKKHYVVPRTRTKLGQKSLLVTRVKIWNKISDKLKNCSYQSFKKAHKSELLSKYK